MKQALILCAGKAKRLRPYSYSISKASLPFLNLPLLAFPWFYLEQLKVSRFLLNSHLFPKKLENTARFLSQVNQETKLFFEEEPLGSAGTLFHLKKELQNTKEFLYINGDSLFFPSQINKLLRFEELFLESNLDGLFFVSPYKDTDFKRALWRDKDYNLKFVGSKENLKKSELKGLSPVSWFGLAFFKSDLLNHLQPDSFDLFQDFIKLLLNDYKIKVYEDPSAVFLEAGDKNSYLSAVKFCLDCLFSSETDSFKSRNVKEILESCFNRFDPQDDKVGLKNGKKWSQKLNQALLLPKSVRGLDFLSLKGPAVIGSESSFLGPSVLEDCILDSQICFKGSLKKEILVKQNLFPADIF